MATLQPITFMQNSAVGSAVEAPVRETQRTFSDFIAERAPKEREEFTEAQLAFRRRNEGVPVPPVGHPSLAEYAADVPDFDDSDI